MIAVTLLAAAVLVAPPVSAARARLFALTGARTPPTGDGGAPGRLLPITAATGTGLLVAVAVGGAAGALLAVPAGLAVAAVARWWCRRSARAEPEPLRLAGGWDLLAACLRSGLPVPVAVRAVAEHLPPGVAAELTGVADRLALGADPAVAWGLPRESPVHRLARAAQRSAHSGAGLAAVAEAAAAGVRADALDSAAARGQRAGVLITGPLGLCFLPAFLVLGVVPVVVGLAGGLAVRW